MNAYKSAAYPSNASVASGVTLLVSVWFVVAAGAILSGPTSPYTQRPAVQAQATPAVQKVAVSDLDNLPDVVSAAVDIPREARLTITVEASRSASLHRSAHL